MRKLIYTFMCSLLFVACGAKESQKETVTIENKEEVVLTPVVEEKPEEPQLVFTVQIAAHKKESTQHAAIEGVQVFKEETLYKYRLGAFQTYQEARKSRASLLKKFPDAFVQAVLGKDAIAIEKALK